MNGWSVVVPVDGGEPFSGTTVQAHSSCFRGLFFCRLQLYRFNPGGMGMACETLPFAAKNLDEIVGYRADARHLRQVGTDKEPEFALKYGHVAVNLGKLPIIVSEIAW